MRLVLDASEERQNVLLLAALDVFIEGSRDGIFFSPVAAQLLGLFDQAVVDGQVGRHGRLSEQLYTSRCVASSRLVCVEIRDRREVPPMLSYESLCATLMNIRNVPSVPRFPFGKSPLIMNKTGLLKQYEKTFRLSPGSSRFPVMPFSHPAAKLFALCNEVTIAVDLIPILDQFLVRQRMRQRR
jgi:hypothetical protein